MSSARYVVELQPDPLLRGAVLLTTLLAGALGVLVLGGLPIDPVVRVLAILAWVTRLAWNISKRHAAERQLLQIRLFADGTAALRRPDSSWTPAVLAAGSTVLARLAWLQFNQTAGRPHTELLCGNSRKSEDWRRLQVIWRHCRTGGHSVLGSGS